MAISKKEVASSVPKVPPAVSRYMSAKGRLGGTKRAENLTEQELSRQAQHAASFRWPKKTKPASTGKGRAK